MSCFYLTTRRQQLRTPVKFFVIFLQRTILYYYCTGNHCTTLASWMRNFGGMPREARFEVSQHICQGTLLPNVRYADLVVLMVRVPICKCLHPCLIIVSLVLELRNPFTKNFTISSRRCRSTHPKPEPCPPTRPDLTTPFSKANYDHPNPVDLPSELRPGRSTDVAHARPPARALATPSPTNRHWLRTTCFSRNHPSTSPLLSFCSSLLLLQ